MTENNWYKLKPAIDVNNPLGYVETDSYNIHYNDPVLDSDNVKDSIKVKILYNELMTLKRELSDTERTLRGEINYLHAENRILSDENKKLSDEVNSIKQALYFG